MLDRGKLRDFAPNEGEAASAQTEGHDDGRWLDVAIPGDVHRTLIAADEIPDPYYDRNETARTWMEEREWWYRLRFDGGQPPATDSRLRLVCPGLDTFATL